MSILLLELKIIRCSGLQILSQLFRAYKYGVPFGSKVNISVTPKII